MIGRPSRRWRFRNDDCPSFLIKSTQHLATESAISMPHLEGRTTPPHTMYVIPSPTPTRRYEDSDDAGKNGEGICKWAEFYIQWSIPENDRMY